MNSIFIEIGSITTIQSSSYGSEICTSENVYFVSDPPKKVMHEVKRVARQTFNDGFLTFLEIQDNTIVPCVEDVWDFDV